MTKQQLLADLQSKFYKVGLVEGAELNDVGYLKRVQEGVLWYLVGVYEKKGDVLLRRNVPIYCEFTGELPKKQKGTLTWDDLPEGNYFYGERLPEEHLIPEPPQPNVFEGVEGEIEKQGKDWVVVKKFVEEAGVIKEKRFLVKKTTEGLKELPIAE